MIELSPLVVMLIMFGSLTVLLLTGMPVVFALGGIGVILLLLLWGTKVMPPIVPGSAFYVMTWYVILAIPLFIFMSMILRSSGVVEDLFRSIRLWLARIPGGLAMACVLVCVITSAMSGLTATGVLILGIIAVPLMLKFGYSKEIAIGPVLAAAALASLIPPSDTFIVYGALALVSVGQLFIGGIIPGLLLASLFIIYIGIRCYLNPELGPPLPPEERVSWWGKIVSLRALVLPGVLIIAILGSIFMGICSPTEAAGVGAMGALVIAAIKRKLTWQALKEACIETVKISSMVMWIFFAATIFKSVFVLSGGPHFVTDWIVGLGIAPLGVIGVMQVAFILLGMFVQTLVMLLIGMPVFLPVVDALGLSRVWFGVLFLANSQIGDLTPPFGSALFYMRSIAPEGVTMADIIRSVLPLIPLQVIVVLLVLFFPQLALWLPGLMLG